MNDMQSNNQNEKMSDETRELVSYLSASLLKLHKLMLEDARADYEQKNGTIESVNAYFQLVIDNPHFAWLRKISSLIALMDEATMLRRLASEGEAQGLLDEVKILLSFKDLDEDFNAKFRSAVEKNSDAASLHRDAAEKAG